MKKILSKLDDIAGSLSIGKKLEKELEKENKELTIDPWSWLQPYDVAIPDLLDASYELNQTIAYDPSKYNNLSYSIPDNYTTRVNDSKSADKREIANMPAEYFVVTFKTPDKTKQIYDVLSACGISPVSVYTNIVSYDYAQQGEGNKNKGLVHTAGTTQWSYVWLDDYSSYSKTSVLLSVIIFEKELDADMFLLNSSFQFAKKNNINAFKDEYFL